MMKQVSHLQLDFDEFIEIVMMWHCSGDVPTDHTSTAEFIENHQFANFLISVRYWARCFGAEVPSTTEVVKTLHKLYACADR